MTAALSQAPWRVLIVEDEPQMRADVREFLQGATFEGRGLELEEEGDFGAAIESVRLKKVDVIILDVYRGATAAAGEPDGLEVLEAVRESGFVSVVLYTAHPEKLTGSTSPFVRLVGKDVDSLVELQKELSKLFSLGIPQIYRALVRHVDHTLRDYMWNFVEGSWANLAPMSGKPEFLRLVLQRLAATLNRDGIERLTEDAFGSGASSKIGEDMVHPADFYIMPPLTPLTPQLGDVRIAADGRRVVVLWPTCDMVDTPPRTPKTDRALCAVSELLSDSEEFKKAKATTPPSKSSLNSIQDLLRNRRGTGPDRFHLLPGFCQLPDLVVDFQRLETFSLAELKAMNCLATLASPYAESLASRFLRYIGRLGTPDLDVAFVMKRLGLTN